MARKILFVAMQMSTHTVRWINQISDQGWDLHLFPVNHVPVHHELRGVTVHQPFYVFHPKQALRSIRSLLIKEQKHENSLHSRSVKAIYPVPVLEGMMPYLNGLERIQLGESEATVPAIYGPKVLARLIGKLKPDLIHSLEFQHCGYTVLKAKELSGKHFPRWLATNWGSDIYYYRQFEAHRRQISRLLRNADYYSCECIRDVGLAKELGFSGRVMPVMPNTGGLDISLVTKLRNIILPSKRDVIMVKGYQHFAGRALTALNAVEKCADILKKYRIVVFSASPEIYSRVDELRAATGLNVEILSYSSHEHMLHMFSQARIYLGVSISDAISTSMLEAMAMGTFPIQTNTSCCSEWITDGESGFEIPADNEDVIANRLYQAAENDALVDKASSINFDTISKRLDQSKLKSKAISFYDEIFNSRE